MRRTFLRLQGKELRTSEITRTTKHGEYRDDGPKVAAIVNPSGA